MGEKYTVTGFYGRGTPHLVHCYSTWGGTWYAVQGSKNINLCPKVVLNSEVDIETLQDIDCVTASKPIKRPQDIVDEVEQ